MKFITAISLISAASSAAAFAGLSSFSRTSTATANHHVATGYRESFVMYENERDRRGNSNTDNVWSVLANTEKWISETLQSSDNGSGGNPYSRKEVNYVCETQQDSPMITANIFKRLREAREMGELHGQSEEDHLAQQGKKTKNDDENLRFSMGYFLCGTTVNNSNLFF